MKRFSIIAIIILLLVPALTVAASPDTFTITADDWAQPRSGVEMAAMAPVRAAVQDWMKHPGYHIVILHSGDEIGGLWASEVEDWLVSLGIPSAHILKRISGQDEGTVTLSVEP